MRGKPGQQRRCPVVLPGRGAGQREPLHDESPDELGQGRAAVEDQPAARSGGAPRTGTGTRCRGGAARPWLTALQRYVTPSQAAVAALMAASDPDRRGR